MCISNIGSRRPKASATASVDASLVSSLTRKSALQQQEQESSSSARPATRPQSSEDGSIHIVVQHDYHDHSNDAASGYQQEHPARGGVVTPFPIKLHEMLDQIAADGLDHVISWQPHGRCFVVHKPKEFVNLLPSYFKLSKLASFQRQLNLYGFQRLTRGQDRGGYYHELFLRDRTFLAHTIQRIKIKGTGVRARSNPEQEPEFWSMPWVGADSPRSCDASLSSSDGSSSVPAAPPCDSLGQIPLQLDFQSGSVSFAGYQQQPQPQQQGQAQQLNLQDDVMQFGDKTFHYLDPFAEERPQWSVEGVDKLMANEAESFFEDFDFPDDIGSEIENDDVFGDMLEQMIA